ncbi:HNH endonuclease [Paenibacillus sp. strain BS8-2]
MSYFFVFQNKTFKEEKAGGFLWAPKKNKKGQSEHHWTRMTEVQKGDVIFNSVDGELHSIIIAKGSCIESNKPIDFDSDDQWGQEGWKVAATYIETPFTIRYKDHMESILAIQGDKYAPFNSIGRGNTGYLFSISEELAEYFFSVLGVQPHDIAPDEDEVINQIEQEVHKELAETIREQIVKVRIGQGVFKQSLRKLENKCKLCGIDHPELLRASHIKPWSASNNIERLDQFNGFLLCSAHDTLFDKGFISFDNEGGILVSPLLENHNKILSNVHHQMKINITEQHIPYLEYHRNYVYKKVLEYV